MPTDKRRLTIITEDWMWDAIERFRHEHHIMSMSRAASELVELGLKEKRPEKPKKPEPPVKRLDEAKLRRHVKALCELLDVTWGDAVEELSQASPTNSAQDESS